MRRTGLAAHPLGDARQAEVADERTGRLVDIVVDDVVAGEVADVRVAQADRSAVAGLPVAPQVDAGEHPRARTGRDGAGVWVVGSRADGDHGGQ